MRLSIHRRMREFSFDAGVPPVLLVLRILGLSHLEIAAVAKRSPSQVTYYLTGKTPIPRPVHNRLKVGLAAAIKVLREMRNHSRLPQAVLIVSQTIYEDYEQLHSIKRKQ